MVHSLVLGCSILGISFKCAAPKGYWMNSEIVSKAKQLAPTIGVKIMQTDKPQDAVKNADIVYTDTWISMGDESERNKRLKAFMNYQVDQELMSLAKPDAIFMHDMPIYRGNEVTAEIINASYSVVFKQAENRLHVQKALLLWILKEKSLTRR